MSPDIAGLRQRLHELGGACADGELDPPLCPATLNALFEHGLFSLTIPRECSGFDASLRDFALCMEDIGVLGPAYSMTAVPHLCISVKSVARAAPAQLRRDVLSAVRRDHRLLAFAITEDQGSDVAAIRTRLAAASGGGLVLNGRKQWITNLRRASHVVVVALCPEMHRAPSAAAFVLIPLDAPGVQVLPPQEKLIANGSDTANLHFDNVPVTSAQLLGEPGKALSYFAELVLPGRVGTAAAALGIVQHALKAVANDVSTPMQLTEIAELSARLDTLRAAVTLAGALGDANHGEFSHATALVKHLGAMQCQAVIGKLDRAYGDAGRDAPPAVQRARQSLGLFRLLKGPGEIIAYQAIVAMTARLREPFTAPRDWPDDLAAHCVEFTRLACELRGDRKLQSQQLLLMGLADAAAALLAQLALHMIDHSRPGGLTPAAQQHARAWTSQLTASALRELRELLHGNLLDRLDANYLQVRAVMHELAPHIY